LAGVRFRVDFDTRHNCVGNFSTLSNCKTKRERIFYSLETS